jgi:hypothetical protein
MHVLKRDDGKPTLNFVAATKNVEKWPELRSALTGVRASSSI